MRKPLLTLLLASVAAVYLLASAEAETIAYSRFEEGQGTSASDSSGRGHHGALSTDEIWNGSGLWDPVPLTGASNTDAIDVTGVREFVYASDSDDWTQSSAFTIECIFKPANAGSNPDQHLVGQWDGSEREYSWRLLVKKSQVYLDLYDGSQSRVEFPDFTISNGETYFVAAIFQDLGEDAQVTFHARQPGSDWIAPDPVTVAGFGTLDNASALFSMGADASYTVKWGWSIEDAYSGVFDEVRFSSGALSQQELLAAPEPATGMALIAAALGALVAWRKRNNSVLTGKK